MRAFLGKLWAKIEEPIIGLSAHFSLSILAILAVRLTDIALQAAHLDARRIPILNVSLSDWLFDLDIVAISVILIVGVLKALKDLW